MITRQDHSGCVEFGFLAALFGYEGGEVDQDKHVPTGLFSLQDQHKGSTGFFALKLLLCFVQVTIVSLFCNEVALELFVHEGELRVLECLIQLLGIGRSGEVRIPVLRFCY